MKLNRLIIIILSVVGILCVLAACKVFAKEWKGGRNGTYQGIDVSHHQGNINWRTVAQNKKIQFVYIKATEGKTYLDPKPTHYNKSKTYPLIVFCHGYLGNWKLYQGILGDFDNAIVLNIGTTDLSGIFNQSDIGRIFSFYIPALERMGYKIDHKQLHLVGLSNGGSAISAPCTHDTQACFRA